MLILFEICIILQILNSPPQNQERKLFCEALFTEQQLQFFIQICLLEKMKPQSLYGKRSSTDLIL